MSSERCLTEVDAGEQPPERESSVRVQRTLVLTTDPASAPKQRSYSSRKATLAFDVAAFQESASAPPAASQAQDASDADRATASAPLVSAPRPRTNGWPQRAVAAALFCTLLVTAALLIARGRAEQPQPRLLHMVVPRQPPTSLEKD